MSVTALGELSLWVAVVMSAWAGVMCIVGDTRERATFIVSGSRALTVALGFLLIAVGCLLTLLVRRDFSVAYVAYNTSLNLPTAFALAALWAGASGSLLLWATLLAAVSAIFVVAPRDRSSAIRPMASGVLALVLLALTLALAVSANPFAHFEGVTSDGRGMAPPLQSAWMSVHPPLLYLGLAASTVPFALTIGALHARRLDAEWLTVTRRWTVFTWLMLATALLMGMRWAYLEEGWGGFWAWDPVQNAALMPWLIYTASLHAMLRRGPEASPSWPVVWCSIAGFTLTLVSAYLARSGALASMHSFVAVGAGAQPTGARWIFNLLLIVVLGSAMLWFARRNRLPAREVQTTSVVPDHTGNQWLNRALVLGAGIVVLSALAVVVLWGTIFPLLAAALKQGPATLGPGYFNGVGRPLAVLLLVLIAAASFTRAEGTTDRGVIRRLAGGLAHVGVIAMFVAVAGVMFSRQSVGALNTGDVLTAQDPFGARWTFTSQGMSTYEEINRQVLAVSTTVARSGKSRGMLTSAQRQFFDGNGDFVFEPTTQKGVRSTLLQDVDLVFTGSPARDVATVRVTFTPFAVWLWIGGAMIIVSALLLLIPAGRDA